MPQRLLLLAAHEQSLLGKVGDLCNSVSAQQSLRIRGLGVCHDLRIVDGQRSRSSLVRLAELARLFVRLGLHGKLGIRAGTER